MNPWQNIAGAPPRACSICDRAAPTKSGEYHRLVDHRRWVHGEVEHGPDRSPIAIVEADQPDGRIDRPLVVQGLVKTAAILHAAVRQRKARVEAYRLAITAPGPH